MANDSNNVLAEIERMIKKLPHDKLRLVLIFTLQLI